MKSRRGNSGSVLLLVIGLLTIIALLGSSFVVIATMDRKTSRSVAAVAPMDTIALSVVAQLVADRYLDTYTDATGPFGAATDSALKYIDYPSELVDKALASTTLDANNRWGHLTNLSLSSTPDPNYVNVPYNDPKLTDTGAVRTISTTGPDPNYGDARLFDTGQRDPYGRSFWAGVRMIDASGLVNANTAYDLVAAAPTDGSRMPVTNIVMTALDPAFTTAFGDGVHNYRRGTSGADIRAYNLGYVLRPLNPLPPAGKFLPFDPADQVPLYSAATDPNIPNGRLSAVFGNSATDRALYNRIRAYMTTWSAARASARRATGTLGQGLSGTTVLPNNYRFDINFCTNLSTRINDPNVTLLFNAFYNAIPAGIPGISGTSTGTADDKIRRTTAAQMTVNTIAYRSNDSNVPAMLVPAVTPAKYVYGINRQPFVSKVFFKIYNNAGTYLKYAAIELMNPYNTPIYMGDYALENPPGIPSVTLSGIIPAATSGGPGRMVIASHDTAKIPVRTNVTPAPISQVVANLDLNLRTRITRLASPAPNRVLIADFTCPTATTPANGTSYRSLTQWDDNLGRARYTLASVFNTTKDNAADYSTEYPTGTPKTATNTELGWTNPGSPADGTPKCPIYVRNGPFTNIGELTRIYFIGPSDANDIRQMMDVARTMTPVITDSTYAVGRFDPASGFIDTNYPASVPRVPIGALLTDHLMVGNPYAEPGNGDYVTYGPINVNTAPLPVLKCLPTIGAPTLVAGDKDLLAKQIINYRDNLNTRPLLTNLRGLADANQVGIASIGEIAIPIWQAATAAAFVAKLPQNTYPGTNACPSNYTVAGVGADNDDGLLAASNTFRDLIKQNVYYAWLSNQISVRSDVFICFIRIQIGGDPKATDTTVRRYVAVIDRSRVKAATDRPAVVMFAEIK